MALHERRQPHTHSRTLSHGLTDTHIIHAHKLNARTWAYMSAHSQQGRFRSHRGALGAREPVLA